MNRLFSEYGDIIFVSVIMLSANAALMYILDLVTGG